MRRILLLQPSRLLPSFVLLFVSLLSFGQHPCPVNDVNVTVNDVCEGGSPVVNIANNQNNLHFTIRNDADNSPMGGPVLGTGGPVNITSSAISINTTYNVVAESDRHSIYFNGGQTLNIAENNLLDLFDNFTIEGWIKPDGTSDYSRLFNKTLSYALGLSNGQSQLCFTSHTSGDYCIPYSFTTDVWYHIAASYTSGTVTLYVNGVSIGQVSSVPTPLSQNNGASIGSDNNGTHNHFRGNIDNVRVWSSVRTVTEIADNMHNYFTGSGNPTLVGSWWMTEMTGLPQDYSGNGLHASSFTGIWEEDTPNTVCGLDLSATPTSSILSDNTITLTSAPSSETQTVCLNTPIEGISYSTTGATDATFTNLPPGVTGEFSAGLITISGSPNSATGSPFMYEITLVGGCGNVTASGSISVITSNTYTLTSGPGTDAQAVCNNTPIANITYSTTGATGAIFNGFPTGINTYFSGGMILISGVPNSPSMSPIPYTIQLTGGCGMVIINGTIHPLPDNTLTLTSDFATQNQTVCVNQNIENITYSSTGATGASFTGLPDGVTGNFSNGNITISGSPTTTLGSPFNYTVNLTGGCGTISLSGGIIVNPENTVTHYPVSGPVNQSVCVNTAIENIVYFYTGATGASFSNLPDGVTGSFMGGSILISGTPTTTIGSPFNYTVTLTGGCGNITATGTIQVSLENTITLSSSVGTDGQTVCVNTPIENITYAVTGATGATFTGLPDGVSGTYNAGQVTISGAPSTAVGSPFNYSVNLTGGCGTISESGTLTVTPDNTITPTSAPGTTIQSVCINTAIEAITYSSTGATGAIFSNLPDGVTGSFMSGNVLISGTPTTSIGSPFIYSVTLTGGCGNVSTIGTIQVIPDNTITLSSSTGSDAQTVCINTSIVNITYNVTGATGATFTGLPDGVSGTYNAGLVTISGSPTESLGSPFNYTIQLTGGCGTISAQGTISVNPDNTITLTSDPSTTTQSLCILTPIAEITYASTGATGASYTNLPDGVTGNFNAGVITISGAPNTTVGSPFEYSVNLSGGCGLISATGTITVIPDNTITLVSDPGTDNQSLCANVAIEPIEFVTTGATNVTFLNVPSGVETVWENDTVLITGGPGTTIGSPFEIIIQLEGGCGIVSDTVVITVVNSIEAVLTSGTGTNVQSICLDEEIIPITYTVEGATTVTFSGLPPGVTGLWEGNSITISGAPGSLIGSPFAYEISFTGDCPSISAGGSISVLPVPEADPVNDVYVCNGEMTDLVDFTSPAGEIGFNWVNAEPGIGLPAMGTGDIEAFLATNTGDAPLVANISVSPASTTDFDCTQTDAMTFTQTTPIAIPTGPAVVSSTLVVSDAPVYLMDVNIQTFLTHTFAADLDITIMSPEGTVVTLSTDNGAGNDNVFNGTIWDDSANPGGQVPYTTNAGLATDHPYVNNTTASNLVPEEALGAFIGENPNGTWTITISDDAAADGGNLASWSIILQSVTTPPASQFVQFTNSTPVAVPTGPAVVSSTLAVSGAPNYLLDLNLFTDLTHTFSADLDITIQSPAGTVVTLTTDNGGANDNTFAGTLWDDSANPGGQTPYVSNTGLSTDHPYVNLTPATNLVPEEAMAAFIGENPNGIWTITISDDAAGDEGSLNSWRLDITATDCGGICAGDTVYFDIIVNPTPKINPISDITFCNADDTEPIVFSSPTTGGTIAYQWWNDNTATGLAASGNGDIPSFFATNNTNDTLFANIKVVAEFTNGGVTCTSDTLYFVIKIDPLPCGWSTNPNGINCPDGSSVDFSLENNTWTLTSTNCYYPPTSGSDQAAFVQQTLCGDGSITARVTQVTGGGWAGITMRETIAAGSKKIAFLTNLSAFHRREIRTTTNGISQMQQFASSNRFWLRITRTGNQFNMFASPNGSSWFPVGSQVIAMNSCIEIGLIVTNPNANSTVTGTFANVSTSGNNMPVTRELPITGLNQEVPWDATIYPNPATNELNINLEQLLGQNVTIVLTDIHGRTLESFHLDKVNVASTSIQINRIPSGMYLVHIKNGKSPDLIKKLIINR